MKFTIHQVTPQGVRIGRLSISPSAEDSTVSNCSDTPLCIPHTRAGLIPYLTPDIVSNLQHKPQAAMLTMATM